MLRLQHLPRLVLASVALAIAPLAAAQTTLTVSAISDEAITELQRKFKPLGEYLE